MNSDAIAADIRGRIASGRLSPRDRPDDALPVGSAIPTVDQLAAQYKVDRNTAHRAHGLLKAAGLIHSMKGRPAVVADQSPLYVITIDAYDKAVASGRTAWEQQVSEIGETGRTVHYTGRLTEAPDLGQDSRGVSVPELFGVAPETEFLHLSGDGWSTPLGPTGEPDPKLERVVQIYDGWFDPSLVEVEPKFLQPRDETWAGGAYAVIASATGRQPVPTRRVITERITTKTEEVRFRVPPMTPISAEVELSLDQDGKPLCVVWYRRLFGVAQWDLTQAGS